ncbi:MAG: Flp pilus assembly protein CpaB [Thermoguttaceae bacterium]|nr:Flp pilus assembly protein CpaB [Thermoguttaceae bacterium]MDW8038628.1 Flp pilus assembly protein CpaB [Thermoguttaceae bacterium]
MRRVSPATVTFGVLAILFGLGTAYAVRQYLKPPAPQPSPPAPQPQMVDLVVAAVNLPAYTRIQEPWIKVVRVPADRVPPGAIHSTGRALFRVVKKTVMAEQPLLEENLYAVGELPKLADRLPPGHRAITLPIGGPAALSGMIQPESRIDILLTYQDDTLPGHSGPVTMTLMRNVLVLATSVAAFPLAEDRRNNVQDITVAVTPEQANRLILAQRYGSLSAVLCGQQEGEAAAGGKVAGEEEKHLIDRYALLGIERPQPPAPEEPEPLPPEPVIVEHRVEVWKGGSRAEVVFGEEQILEALNATAVAEGREPMKALPISLPSGSGVQPIPTRKPCRNCPGGQSRAGAGGSGPSARELMQAIRAAEQSLRQQGGMQPTPASVKPASHEGASRQGETSVELRVEAIQTGQ